MNNFKRKRVQPDVRNIRKRSDFSREQSNKIIVGGEREKTTTGYKVPGFSSESFETYYEVMLAGSSTPVVNHATKDKTVRVISGVGFVLLSKKLDNSVLEETQKRIIPGDEIALEKGVTYRIATSNENFEFFVCQNAGYNTDLEIVEQVGIGKDSNDFMLTEPTMEDRLLEMRPQETIPKRRGSKAREQLANLRGDKRSAQVASEVGINLHPESAARVGSINARPTGGRFSDAGAG
jgi:hypothetical protein